MKIIGTLFLHVWTIAGKRSEIGVDVQNSRAVEVPSGEALVNASYEETSEGWFFLNIEAPLSSSSRYSDTWYAAGYAEGLLTCESIRTFYPNFYADTFGAALPSPEVISFVEDQHSWLTQEAAKALDHSKETSFVDPYWQTMSGVLAQLQGLRKGYAESPCALMSDSDLEGLPSDLPAKLRLSSSGTDGPSLLPFLLLNAWGDLYTIMAKFQLSNASEASIEGRSKGDRPNYPAQLDLSQPRGARQSEGARGGEKYTSHARKLRCSALFKLLPDGSDILFGHATWDAFMSLAPRSMKRIALPRAATASDPGPGIKAVLFSSSPGLLSSVDDFYMTNSLETQQDSAPASVSASGSKGVAASHGVRLAVIETTNELFNPELYGLVTPHSALCWQRVLAANSIAANGAEWAQAFSAHHSGTYTNQWMVLDLLLFSPGAQTPAKGLFTVLEEIPGSIVSEDQSARLYAQGYWPSYNIPFYPEIYRRSGNEFVCKLAEVRSDNAQFCYKQASRGQIFAQRQSGVSDIDSFQKLINYNDWQVDPLSLGNPCDAIACRDDLQPNITKAFPSGALDGKASSVKLGLRANPVAWARLGPTHESTDGQPPFCWSNLPTHYVHNGQPACFDYNWFSFPPQ